MRDIDTMPAGREMDALVVERVMGLCWHKYAITVPADAWADERHYECGKCGITRLVSGHELGPRDGQPDHYSADIAAAWQVVAVADTVTVQRYYDPDTKARRNGDPFFWEAVWTRHNPEAFAFARAPTAPLAICRAALKAVTR